MQTSQDLSRKIVSLLGSATRTPIEFARLTAPQCDFVKSTERRLLWRAANQIGKSYGAAFDIVHNARGTSPFRQLFKPPVRILVASKSWPQMDAFLEKIWAMLPKDEIDGRARHEKGGGIRGFKEPRIPFTSGPGNGSVITFATYEQGTERIAGGTYHFAYLDEPCDEQYLGEVLPRLNRHNGYLRMTMTPTPESPPLGYLREMVKNGRISELQTSITEDAITPLGGLLQIPWRTKGEIEDALSIYLEIERGMREHGDWDAIVAGRWLSAFSAANVTQSTPVGKLWTAVGIDHGAKAGRQAVSLVACEDTTGRCWVLDEVRSDGRTSTGEDARGILAMLDRHPWIGGWEGVDYWAGDRAHGGDFYGNKKSNSDLMHELASIIGLSKRSMVARGLRIDIPFKNAGSVYRGLRLMNSLLKDERLLISINCERLLEAVKSWDGKKDDPLKDPIDSARYAIEKLHERNLINMSETTELILRS